MSTSSRTPSSNSPYVEGYVIIVHPSVSLYCAALRLKSATSMYPFASHFTTTTSNPAIVQLAGFVPCADCGTRHTLRCPCPVAFR